MKTLFLKDSVLFISIDGKEYEVLEQDIRLSLDGDRGSIPAKRVIENLGRIEWPGGVELIEREVPTGGSGSTSYPIFENVARLLPKEKKENKICIASHGPVSAQAESDYQQFEGKNLHIVTPESSEPHDAPVESQEELWEEMRGRLSYELSMYVSSDSLKEVSKVFKLTRLTP